MENEKLISVIVPVYNGEKYLAECVENILLQTYKKLEIIVVNDGSTDRTAAIAENFPVKIISLPQNRGLSVARNTGMDLAKGEYIHFMDVDDAINPDFYKEMMAAIIDTDADIACSGMINELKPHRTILFTERLLLQSTEEKLKMTNVGKWGFSVRYLFQLNLLRNHNLRFEEGRFIEDLPFSLPAVYFAKRLVVVPHAVYTYIRREDSIMTKKDKAHRKKRHRDLRHVKEFRHHFARKHHFKIPGIPTGRFSLFFVKWFT
ncbi:MAG: glycosyltransferase [Candidatus Azobacteroides sp.]|nr:glycosyltransferase [Candidatus Azobacteroides sp.]